MDKHLENKYTKICHILGAKKLGMLKRILTPYLDTAVTPSYLPIASPPLPSTPLLPSFTLPSPLLSINIVKGSS